MAVGGVVGGGQKVSSATRMQKVSKIFLQFDGNGDGGLDREEMAALVVAVNPRVKFSEEQIAAILDEVFRTYSEFIDGEKGLTFEGLLRTYDDGAGDVDRDFDALGLDLDLDSDSSSFPTSQRDPRPHPPPLRPTLSSTTTEDRGEIHSGPGTSRKRQSIAAAAAWASSPNHGIVYDDTWRLVEELEIAIKHLETKISARLRKKEAKKHRGYGTDSSSDDGNSRELGGPGLRFSLHNVNGVGIEELGHDYSNFAKELGELRQKADASRTQEEAFDAHMGIGRTLYDHTLYKEALASFKRATELKPTDVRPHFRCGNTFYSLNQHSEAREAYTLALEAAEITGPQWNNLLPQIHVNLGIALEGEGMLLGACEHYKEAAIREPKHYRALKLLGSALFGVGEYRAAEKALGEAIYLKPDYADAHCDLGSVLHTMGEEDRAIQEFEKAIELKPDHIEALYNLGGLYKDVRSFPQAANMYSKVLAVQPNHWRAQLNKAVALLGAGEIAQAKRAFKQAYKMTNRVELYDALVHLRQMQKKPGLLSKKRQGDTGTGGGSSTERAMVIDASRFRRIDEKTTLRQWLAFSLDIRVFQRHTRIYRCDVLDLKREMGSIKLPVSTSGVATAEKSIRKEELEKVLRRLLHFLKPETFQGAVRVINERVLSALDSNGTGRVDLAMFFALLSPVCGGPLDKRKRTAFDALVWRSSKNVGAEIAMADASLYMKLLHSVYLPSEANLDDTADNANEDREESSLSYLEFVEMFDDPIKGFGILTTLAKLEGNDRVRHGGFTCSVCSYPIIGPRFKEVTAKFSLCGRCYSEGKVPAHVKQEEFCFKEFDSETDAVKDKLRFFRSRPTTPPAMDV